MAEPRENCILCDKSLDSGQVRVLQRESIRNLIQASKKRRDEKHHQLENLNALTVHANCTKSYTSQKSINYAKKKFRATFVTNSYATRASRRYKIKNSAAPDDASDEPSASDIEDPEALESAIFVSGYICRHRDQHDFCIKDILSDFPGDSWTSVRYLKKFLENIYGQCIVVDFLEDKGPTFTIFRKFSGGFGATLAKTTQGLSKSERTGLMIKLAADLLVDDILKHDKSVNTFTDSQSFEEQSRNEIPDSLWHFLSTIIMTDKEPDDEASLCIAPMAHAIMAAVREVNADDEKVDVDEPPRLPSIQVGLASMIKNDYGDDKLVDTLNYYGICSSSKELEAFEAKVGPERKLKFDNSFSQYISENLGYKPECSE